MRILTLAGKNLASLREAFEIHFDREPLASAGLFAITGATGAGKSTLLDAICLPLYNQIPRLNGTREQGKIVEQVGKHTVSANDPRQILRRGAGEGYASVRFQTPEGKIYTARWDVWRAGKRADGALQTELLTLEDVNGNHLDDSRSRKADYLQKLQGIIGLSFDQFTSAILLAQGDFAAFLEAKSDEKSTLLELLTHTENFTQISTAIYNHYDRLKKEHETLRQQIEQLACLSEKEKRELQTQLLTNEEQSKQFGKQLEAFQLAIEWQKSAILFANATAEAKRIKEAKHMRLLQLDETHSWVKQWEESQTIRQELDDSLRVEKKLKALQESYIADEDALKRIAEYLLQQEKELEILQQQQIVLEKEGTELEHTLRQLEELTTAIGKSENERKKSEEECAKIKNEGTTIAQEKKKQEETVADLEKKLAKRDSTLKELSPYKGLYEQYESFKKEVTNLLQNVEVQKELRKQNIALEVQLLGILQKQQQLEQELKILVGCDAVEVITLRAHLRPGVPCPVCGSVLHTHRGMQTVVASGKSLDEIEKETERVGQALEKTKTELEQCKEAKIRIETTLKSQKEAFDGNIGALIPALTSYIEKLPSVEALNLSLEFPDQDERALKIESDLRQLNKELEKVGIECEVWRAQEKQGNLEGELEQARKLLENYTQQREKLLQHYKESDGRKKEHENELKTLKEKHLQQCKGKTPAQLQEAFNLKKTKLEIERKQNEAEVQKLKAEKEKKSNAKAQTQGQITELMAQAQKLDEQIRGWYKEHSDYTPETIKLLNTHNAEEVRNYKTVREQEEKGYQHQLGIVKEREKQQEEHERKKTELAALELEELQKGLLECSHQKEIVEGRVQELRLKAKENEHNEERRRELQKKLDDGKLLLGQWEELNSLFGSSNGRKFREIAQSYTLQDLITFANYQLEQIMPRYRLERSELSQQDRPLLILNIVDAQMMGAQRNVDTLSGGEKFIVSLALSLALSSISAHSNTIEMLFIDEGFGTLDPNHLRMVLEALEHLEQQGRRIGLISHVAELNESIPVQIHVEKIDGDSSRVVVLDRR